MPADTLFTDYGFPVTGAVAPYAADRTLPDRLAEIKNVRDFGAVGDGINNDAPYIQAAVDALSGSSRGTVYFPPGTYKINQSIVFSEAQGDSSIIFRGEGNISVVTGSFTDFLLDINPAAPPGGIVIIENLFFSNSGKGIRLHRTCGMVRNCGFSCHWGIICSDAALAGVNGSPSCTIQNCYMGWGAQVGSIGIAISGNSSIIDCDVTAYDKAICLYGTGNNVIGGRYEMSRTGIALGVTETGDTSQPANGFAILSLSMESNTIGIDFVHGAGHGLIAGVSLIAFTGPETPQYGINLRSDRAGTTLIAGCGFSAGTIASINIEDSTNRAFTTFVSTTASNGMGGAAWAMPTKAHAARFINCNNPAPIFTFANLPIGSNVTEGDQYDISDGNDGSSTSFRTPITGGGSARVRARASQIVTSSLGTISNGTESLFNATIGGYFMATIAGSVMTVQSMADANSIISVGDTVNANGSPTITGQIDGTPGGAGRYNLSAAPGDIGSSSGMQTSSNVLNVISMISGTILHNGTFSLSAPSVDGLITSQSSGADGGIGHYVFDGSQHGYLNEAMGAGLPGNILTPHGTNVGTFAIGMSVGCETSVLSWIINGGSGPFTLTGDATHYVGPSLVTGVSWTVCG